MLHAKRAAKRKRRNKAIPVLGAAGLLSLASGPFAQAAGPAANLPTRTIEPRHELILSEEEVFDVSLATFYVFDRENTALASPGFQLVRGGCGGGGTDAAAVAMDAAAVATDAAAVDAAAATHLVATAVVASTVAAVAEALEDVAGAASGGGAAAAVYRGARASSARPHGLVAAEAP
jgi:hypothetical protein